MSPTLAPRHRLEIDGLAEAIAAAPLTDKHAALLNVLRTFDALPEARLALVQDQDSWLVKRKVLDADGQLVHDDHETWLAQQLAADGGHAETTRRRLQASGYLLTRCELVTLFVVHDRLTPNPADFVQVEVYIEDERLDCHLFDKNPWRTVQDLRDLVRDCEGAELDEAARRPFRPPVYRLAKVSDVAAFVEEAEALVVQRREELRTKTIMVTDMQTGSSSRMTQDQISPGWDRYPGKSQRLFNDWAASSAGRSGARICEHWVMQLSASTDRDGRRWLSLVPMWTFGRKMAKVEGGKGSAYELFGKLEKIDSRTRVPFAWYFYMLHGNLVGDYAARRVIKAAEDGLIVLPEHDYRVLVAWKDNEYGF